MLDARARRSVAKWRTAWSRVAVATRAFARGGAGGGAALEKKRDALDALLAVSPVIPVVALPDAARAPALGRALLDGGVGILEVTLRTGAALDAIRALRRTLPELRVGCGTVTTRAQRKRRWRRARNSWWRRARRRRSRTPFSQRPCPRCRAPPRRAK